VIAAAILAAVVYFEANNAVTECRLPECSLRPQARPEGGKS